MSPSTAARAQLTRSRIIVLRREKILELADKLDGGGGAITVDSIQILIQHEQREIIAEEREIMRKLSESLKTLEHLTCRLIGLTIALVVHRPSNCATELSR